MINFKQNELGNMLFETLKKKFPEIGLESITESAESAENIWVNIYMPENDDKEIEVRELASEVSTNILLDYGYHITICSTTAYISNPKLTKK